MSSEEKKEKFIFDELHPEGGTFHNASSKDLYKFFEGYNAKTVEAEEKRNQIQQKKVARIENLQSVINKTLKEVHGVHPDSEGTPLKYDLAGVKDGETHAIKLLDGLVEEFYKQNFGKNAFDVSNKTDEGKRQMLRQFNQHVESASQGQENYSSLLNKLTEQTDYAMGEDFSKIVQSLSHVEEEHHINEVTKLLAQDRRHKNYIFEKANELYKDHGVQLREGVDQIKSFTTVRSAFQGDEHKIKYSQKKIFEPYKK